MDIKMSHMTGAQGSWRYVTLLQDSVLSLGYSYCRKIKPLTRMPCPHIASNKKAATSDRDRIPRGLKLC